MKTGDKLKDKEGRQVIEIQGNVGKLWFYISDNGNTNFETEKHILKFYTLIEPISEEDEKDQEDIKRLEGKGAVITWPSESEKQMFDLLNKQVMTSHLCGKGHCNY